MQPRLPKLQPQTQKLKRNKLLLKLNKGFQSVIKKVSNKYRYKKIMRTGK